VRPLIEDVPTRGLVERTVREIGDALAARDAQTPFEIADHAVACSYLERSDDRAGRLLAEAVRRFNGHTPALGMDRGGARLGWTIAHLANTEVADDRCARLDRMLACAVADWIGEYDLMTGLVGFGVYALERGEAGRELATAVLDRLERSAIGYGEGLAWFTAAELLPPSHQKAAPDGYWNLGLPYGVPGVIALLARYIAADVAPLRARILLEGAVTFVLSAAPASPEAGRFPPWHPYAKPISPRLAWCYGDLAVASALIGAGLHARVDAWTREGLVLAHACAGRTLAQARIHDACLCHGAAGIAHMFHRIARATNDDALYTAARAWIGETLRMRTDAPIAGYPRVIESRGQLGLEEDASILTGCAGVALALQAAISDVPPAWDRLLLIDLPI
jgi:hypothetical protein